MSAVADPEFPCLDEAYPLKCQYNIWSHSITNRNWTPSSYQLLHTFDTLRGFFDFFQAHPNPQTGMFFIMRDPIVPTWEDSHNAAGGCWSFRVDKGRHIETWTELAIHMVGNAMTGESSAMDSINGISLTIRRSNAVIKVWNTDRRQDGLQMLRRDLPNMDLKSMIYQPHAERP
jgi:hypothetical protein